MKKLKDSDVFSFCLPFDVLKSTNAQSDECRIGGYASTSSEDRQGDEIVQKGLDYEDFVNYGWFNFDHDNTKILGYPDKAKCKIDSHGFYVEGTLLKGVPLAESIWETAIALQKSGTNRKFGFSVEGKILKRDSLGKIVKARVYNVAITPNPVNTTCTWDALVKSFTTDTEEIDKALEAGHGDANGSPIVPESLESAFKTLSYAVGDDEDAKNHMSKLRKKLLTKQDITKSEFILYLQLTKGLSYEASRELAETLSK